MNELLILLVFEVLLIALLIVLLLTLSKKGRKTSVSVKEDLKKIKDQVLER